MPATFFFPFGARKKYITPGTPRAPGLHQQQRQQLTLNMAQPPVYVQNAQGQYVPAQQQPPQYVQQAPQVRRAPDQRTVLPLRAALRAHCELRRAAAPPPASHT